MPCTGGQPGGASCPLIGQGGEVWTLSRGEAIIKLEPPEGLLPRQNPFRAQRQGNCRIKLQGFSKQADLPPPPCAPPPPEQQPSPNSGSDCGGQRPVPHPGVAGKSGFSDPGQEAFAASFASSFQVHGNRPVGWECRAGEPVVGLRLPARQSWRARLVHSHPYLRSREA